MSISKKVPGTFLLISIMYYGILPFVPDGGYQSTEHTHTIYLTTNQIHTSFLFPKNDASEFLKFIPIDKFKVGDFEAIELSFGDKDFFIEVPTWDKVTVKVLLDSLFSPDKGLMHVDLFRKIPASNNGVIKILINDDQYKKLVKYILASFQTSNNLPITYKNFSYYGTDRFFLSTKKFYIFNTCNTWVWEALGSAEIKRGISGPHKWGILFHLK